MDDIKKGILIKSEYRPRIADGLLDAALHTTGAVQVAGPKWCGKTTTARRLAQETIYIQDPDRRNDYRRIAEEKPSLLLRGEKPLLIDEWQDIPVLWDSVRFAVDKDSAVGQYILTGSSVPAKRDILHSGAGRFSKIVMRPMSLFESGESSGGVSLADIVLQQEIFAQCTLSLEEIAFAVCRGGWPASVVENDSYAVLRARDYVESIIESDVSRVDGVDKNPKRVRLLMRSLARNESTEAAMTTIRADMATDDGTLSVNTIAGYLEALRRLYVVDEQEAWAPAVRSKVSIRTSSVRRYCDPSIAAALLGLTPEKLLVDFNTFGLLFESLCIRDLKVYANASGGSVSHYRDARGLECDAIVEYPDGRWCAVEVKFAKGSEDTAATNLLKIAREVRSQHGGAASFLIILTAGEIAYKREDGVYVVPIGCLKP
jgi:predicted AAA+ superfamily ATPase